MTLANQPRAFFRTGVEEEEITPPCKQRSFDSLSVAHILQAKLDTTEPMGWGEGGFGRPSSATSPAASSSPGSPSIGDAAALLSRVQSASTLDNAADCLLSLAMLSGGGHDAAPPRAPPAGRRGAGAMKPPKFPATSKRPHASMKGGKAGSAPSQQTAAGGGANVARRRLKMAKPAGWTAADGLGDAAQQNAPPQAAGYHAGVAAGAPSPPRTGARSSGGQGANKGRSNGGKNNGLSRPRSLAPGHAASAHYRAQQQQHQLQGYYLNQHAAPLNVFTVSGVGYPIRLLSGASLEQLKLLSAAFQLCPHPNPQQILAIGARVGLTSEKLETWFQSRRVSTRARTPSHGAGGTSARAHPFLLLLLPLSLPLLLHPSSSPLVSSTYSHPTTLVPPRPRLSFAPRADAARLGAAAAANDAERPGEHVLPRRDDAGIAQRLVAGGGRAAVSSAQRERRARVRGLAAPARARRRGRGQPCARMADVGGVSVTFHRVDARSVGNAAEGQDTCRGKQASSCEVGFRAGDFSDD